MFFQSDNLSICHPEDTPDGLWYLPSMELHKYPNQKGRHRPQSTLRDRSGILQTMHVPLASLFRYILWLGHTRKASICISFRRIHERLSRNSHYITMVLWEVHRVHGCVRSGSRMATSGDTMFRVKVLRIHQYHDSRMRSR